jgi:hypothetical protein
LEEPLCTLRSARTCVSSESQCRIRSSVVLDCGIAMTLSSRVAHLPSTATLKSYPRGWVVNGIVKGVAPRRLLAVNLGGDSPLSFLAAASVTTYTAMTGTPPLLFTTP